MANVNVTQVVQQKIQSMFEGIFGSEEETARFVADPEGSFAAHDVCAADLEDINVHQVVGSAASFHHGSSGGWSPPADIVQQVTQISQQYVDDHSTEVTVFGDGNVVDTTTSHADGDGAVAGDDLYGVATGENSVAAGDDVDGAATGDGAVAAGDDVENAATGDGAQIIDGDNYGQAVTGDDNELVGGDKMTATDGGVIADGDISAPVNTGTNTGIMADGDVENAVVGDGNETNQVSGSADDANFGSNSGLMGGIDIDTGSGSTSGGTGGAGGTSSGGSSGSAMGGAGAAGGAAAATSTSGGGGGGGLFPSPFGGGGSSGGSSTATGGAGGSGGSATSGDGGDGEYAGGGSVGDTTGGSSGDVNLNLNFGGDQAAANQSDIDDTAMGSGATNTSDIDDSTLGDGSSTVSDNYLEDGSALSNEGDATGSLDDVSVEDSMVVGDVASPVEDTYVPPEPEPETADDDVSDSAMTEL